MSGEKIIVQIDPDLEDLIPGFLQNRSNDIENLRKAATAKDFETLRSVGHGLKGVGGGYGFARITELGAEIETSAKTHDLESINQSILNLVDYLERVEVVYE